MNRWPELCVRDMAADEAMQLWQLFHDTIHSVNSVHYTATQLNAWAPPTPDVAAWTARMASVQPFVATMDGTIVGFSDLQPDGLIDFLYVHHAWQGQGVASALLAEVERRAEIAALGQLHSFVSRTAEPVFLKHGFVVDYRQQVEVRGVRLPNCHMVKQREQIAPIS